MTTLDEWGVFEDVEKHPKEKPIFNRLDYHLKHLQTQFCALVATKEMAQEEYLQSKYENEELLKLVTELGKENEKNKRVNKALHVATAKKDKICEKLLTRNKLLKTEVKTLRSENAHLKKISLPASPKRTFSQAMKSEPNTNSLTTHQPMKSEPDSGKRGSVNIGNSEDEPHPKRHCNGGNSSSAESELAPPLPDESELAPPLPEPIPLAIHSTTQPGLLTNNENTQPMTVQQLTNPLSLSIDNNDPAITTPSTPANGTDVNGDAEDMNLFMDLPKDDALSIPAKAKSSPAAEKSDNSSNPSKPAADAGTDVEQPSTPSSAMHDKSSGLNGDQPPTAPLENGGGESPSSDGQSSPSDDNNIPPTPDFTSTIPSTEKAAQPSDLQETLNGVKQTSDEPTQ